MTNQSRPDMNLSYNNLPFNLTNTHSHLPHVQPGASNNTNYASKS